MDFKKTRFDGKVVIDEKPEYKSTGEVGIAIGAIGETPATDKQPAQPLWSCEMAAISIRRAGDPREAQRAFADALRKVAAEVEQAKLE